MTAFRELEKLSVKAGRLRWSSLTFILLLISVDAYASVTKSSTLYLFLLERVRSEFYATTLMSLQGIIALTAPFLGLMSDRVKSTCRRMLCPLIGMAFLLSGFLTFGALAESNRMNLHYVIGLPTALIFIYIGVILIELSALTAVVDDFPPYQRTPLVSLIIFIYLGVASFSFIANAYTLPVEALTVKRFLTPAIITGVLTLTAVLVRAFSTGGSYGEYKGVSQVSEVVRGLSRFKGLKELYLSLFLIYVYFTAVATSIAPSLYESFHGVTITSGYLIPVDVKLLSYIAQVFFNVGGMAGALSFNFLAKLIDYRKIPLGGISLFIAGFLLALIVKSVPAGLLLAIASGYGWGAYLVFTVLYPAMVASKENPGIIYGLLILSYSLAYAVGPYLIYTLVAITGTYILSHLLMLAIPVAGMWLTARILK